MWKYTKVCVNPRRGNTRFHMWKFTWDRVFPHVEIHQKLWISQHAEIHIFWCISTCGNSSGKVNFRMSVYKRICEFPRGKTCGNTRFFADFRMRKYTRICEFPPAEIHAERCITACGITLNQVQKNSSKIKEIGCCTEEQITFCPFSPVSLWSKNLIYSKHNE